MKTTLPTEILTLLQKGIAAARAGRSREARAILQQVIDADPLNEMAWLWLSGLVATKEQKQVCLERVLEANPNNVYAQAGLKRLQSTAPVEADILEARLASVTNGQGKKSPGPNATNQTRPTTGQSEFIPSLEKGTTKPANKEPSDTTFAPGPDSLETTCPACDLPISLQDTRCPHCFISFDLFSNRDVPASALAPAQSLKPQRRNILRFLGTLLTP